MQVTLDHKDNLKLSKDSLERVIEKLGGQNYSTLNNALFRLFKESHREIGGLEADMMDLTSCSLHSRNIFELYLIMLHVYSDEKALNSWYGQLHKDSKDIKVGFIALLKKRGMDTSEFEELQRFEDKTLDESDFQSKGGFQIRDLAEKYGYLEDYLFVYKLNSKLIHPTSMKVNIYDVLTENDNYLKVVIQIGVFFSQKVEEFALNVEG